MPLFEVETSSHIIITWAEDDRAATDVVEQSYPQEPLIRITRRPRDTWVISKSALGISGPTDPCSTARDCLAKAGHGAAIRLTCRNRRRLERSARSSRTWMVVDKPE